MAFMRVVKVTIVQIVDVAAVTYRGVAPARPMLMSMAGMGRGGASRRETTSFPSLKCAGAAARIWRGTFVRRIFGERWAVRQGRTGESKCTRAPRQESANPFPKNGDLEDPDGRKSDVTLPSPRLRLSRSSASAGKRGAPVSILR